MCDCSKVTLLSLSRNLVDAEKEDGVTTFNAGFLRMVFHDCWGGCDGCIDFDNGGNAGNATMTCAMETLDFYQ